MQTIKEEAIQVIGRLSEDADMEDIIEALCLRLTIEERLRELDAGQYVEHEDVKERLLGR
jgi:predicted transcriptional regulator